MTNRHRKRNPLHRINHEPDETATQTTQNNEILQDVEINSKQEQLPNRSKTMKMKNSKIMQTTTIWNTQKTAWTIHENIEPYNLILATALVIKNPN